MSCSVSANNLSNNSTTLSINCSVADNKLSFNYNTGIGLACFIMGTGAGLMVSPLGGPLAPYVAAGTQLLVGGACNKIGGNGVKIIPGP